MPVRQRPVSPPAQKRIRGPIHTLVKPYKRPVLDCGPERALFARKRRQQPTLCLEQCKKWQKCVVNEVVIIASAIVVVEREGNDRSREDFTVVLVATIPRDEALSYPTRRTRYRLAMYPVAPATHRHKHTAFCIDKDVFEATVWGR